MLVFDVIGSSYHHPQPPTPSIALPYTGSMDITLDLFETWNSTLQEAPEASVGLSGQISVRPFSQWRPTRFTVSTHCNQTDYPRGAAFG